MEPNTAMESRIQAAYSVVPEHIRDDIYEAAKWAKDTLTNLEGTGHQIDVMATRDGLVRCSFSKAEWAGEHCGRGMEGGAEAIVMAVCEYMNGA